ncbi:MAG: hypothetical protein EOP07_11260 [Proteobacteria bacterium]|nr:MAG: hypothetical protein EOP07_11260 [Pseudomonadota bacterium]
MNIPIQCDCGKLRGTALDVDTSSGNRMICLCDDCQTYAHFLRRSKDILDANGGTDITPLRPAKIKFNSGVEHLKCARLSPKGMFRFYAGCCNTPIANTMAPWVPFAGTFTAILKPTGGLPARDAATGPVLERMMSDFGIGPLPPGSSNRPSLKFMLGVVQYFLSGLAKGLNKPSPFFDEDSKTPRVEPYILSKTERESLRKLAGPNPAF